MSKAFTKDDAAGEVVVPPRAPLPEGMPNYVTPRGLAALREEHARLASERARAEAAGDANLAALNERVALLEDRLARAELVDPSTQPQDEVRFGATVTLRDAQGAEKRWRIVGVDEADPARGTVAFTSPLARALLGKAVGDEARVRTPAGPEDVEIVRIDYGV
ncbi:MAG TPA: GreA/GreB family elongation factor [Polyangiaceae bacterium]|nr:GreA/GreB family elongation factor [Polyangiaceae bacterium]